MLALVAEGQWGQGELPPALRLELIETENERVLATAGELDVYTASQFEDQALALLQDKPSLVADVSQLEFMDSRGLGALMSVHQRADNFVVRNPNARIRNLIDVSGVPLQVEYVLAVATT